MSGTGYPYIHLFFSFEFVRCARTLSWGRSRYQRRSKGGQQDSFLFFFVFLDRAAYQPAPGVTPKPWKSVVQSHRRAMARNVQGQRSRAIQASNRGGKPPVAYDCTFLPFPRSLSRIDKGSYRGTGQKDNRCRSHGPYPRGGDKSPTAIPSENPVPFTS